MSIRSLHPRPVTVRRDEKAPGTDPGPLSLDGYRRLPRVAPEVGEPEADVALHDAAMMNDGGRHDKRGERAPIGSRTIRA